MLTPLPPFITKKIELDGSEVLKFISHKIMRSLFCLDYSGKSIIIPFTGKTIIPVWNPLQSVYYTTLSFKPQSARNGFIELSSQLTDLPCLLSLSLDATGPKSLSEPTGYYSLVASPWWGLCQVWALLVTREKTETLPMVVSSSSSSINGVFSFSVQAQYQMSITIQNKQQ